MIKIIILNISSFHIFLTNSKFLIVFKIYTLYLIYLCQIFFIFKDVSLNKLVRVRAKGLVSHKYDESYMINLFEDFKEQYIDNLLKIFRSN